MVNNQTKKMLLLLNLNKHYLISKYITQTYHQQLINARPLVVCVLFIILTQNLYLYSLFSFLKFS